MPWWGLPLELVVVWFLWLLAAAAQRTVDDARSGIPDGQRSGVSAGLVLIVPLFFWGAALLCDLVFAPWGSRAVGSIHAVLGFVFLAGFVRSLWILRSLDENL